MAILIGDTLFIWNYGVDYCDAADFAANGDFADWPTGERPVYAYVPAFIYAVPAWLAAATAFASWPVVGREYLGRVRRGTE